MRCFCSLITASRKTNFGLGVALVFFGDILTIKRDDSCMILRIRNSLFQGIIFYEHRFLYVSGNILSPEMVSKLAGLLLNISSAQDTDGSTWISSSSHFDMAQQSAQAQLLRSLLSAQNWCSPTVWTRRNPSFGWTVPWATHKWPKWPKTWGSF